MLSNAIKKLVRTLLGDGLYLGTATRLRAARNFYEDFTLYSKHSSLLKLNDVKQIEARIIMDYHGLEKGMLHEKMKAGFAKDRVERLHKFLKRIEDLRPHNSQVSVAYEVMCKYYEIHLRDEIDISSFFSIGQYEHYREILGERYSENFEGMICCPREDFYAFRNAPFKEFARSRKSVRRFTGEVVPNERIIAAVDLALTAPSVCNRQANRVYLIHNKKRIDEALKIQAGFNGFTENVNQLLILTNDRKYYYSIGERNQCFIDGGIFLMNLLYALHYFEIANCSANWAKEIDDDQALSALFGIPESEKVICLIPIGVAEGEIRVTRSKRRHSEEIIKQL